MTVAEPVSASTRYEAVIGVEVHVRLKTASKMFCDCAADVDDAPPNSRTCPVCLGLPGSLPVANRAAVEHVLATGLALVARNRGPRGLRAFWGLLALGTAVWLAAELLWSVRELDSGVVPFPWWTDVGYLASFVLFGLALFAGVLLLQSLAQLYFYVTMQSYFAGGVVGRTAPWDPSVTGANCWLWPSSSVCSRRRSSGSPWPSAGSFQPGER